MQALVDVNITIKAEVLVAFWAANMEVRLAICKDFLGNQMINEPWLLLLHVRIITPKSWYKKVEGKET